MVVSYILHTFTPIMKKHFVYLFGLLAWCTSTAQAQHHTVSGYITDAAAEETMIGATLYDHTSGNGTVTNAYGYYSLTLPE